jgi:hypothetical protein
MMKKLSSSMCITFWTAKRMLREHAVAAFKAVRMDKLIPEVSGYSALKRVAIQLAQDEVGGEGRFKTFPLSNHGHKMACEVRRYVKGSTRNEMPFLFSIGITLRTGITELIVVDFDKSECPGLHRNKKALTRAENEWIAECDYIEANDLTHAITDLVKESNGLLMRDEGVVWYMPIKSSTAYATVAGRLNKHGANLQMVEFQPDINEALVKNIHDRMKSTLADTGKDIIDQVAELEGNGGKQRANGRLAKLEQLVIAESTLESHADFLGKSYRTIKRSIKKAKAVIDAESLKAFS